MCCLVPSSISIHDLMSDYMLEQWTSSLFIIHCFEKLATCMWPVFFFNLFHLVSTMPCFLLNFVTTILCNYSYAATDYSKHSSFTFILLTRDVYMSWSNLFFFFLLPIHTTLLHSFEQTGRRRRGTQWSLARLLWSNAAWTHVYERSWCLLSLGERMYVLRYL